MSDALKTLGELKVDDLGSYWAVCNALDAESKLLARDEDHRRFLGQQPTPLWQRLDLAWKTFTERVTKAEHLESGDIQTLLTLARFTRNLVAGVAENQVEAFNFEPYIRSAIRYLTSWTMLQREEVRQLTRFLVQALSNIVTSNPELSSSLWQSYMRDAEDSNLFLAGGYSSSKISRDSLLASCSYSM